MKVAIVDYGSGNLHSARKAFERAVREMALSAAIEVTADPAVVRLADRIVLPGVGAFGDCARGLRAIAGMAEALEEAVRRRGAPFLGICVGMQLLAERGREYGVVPGLGWIGGEVVAIEPRDPAVENSSHGMEHDPAAPRSSLACRNSNERRGVARLFRAFISFARRECERPRR